MQWCSKVAVFKITAQWFFWVFKWKLRGDDTFNNLTIYLKDFDIWDDFFKIIFMTFYFCCLIL